MSSDQLVAILAALATITTNIVVIVKVLRGQQITHGRLDSLTTAVNGRMDDLLHEARKAAALEAVAPSDSADGAAS